MKAFGYVRGIRKGQVEGDGPIRQEAAIREYADAHGITIKEVFREESVGGTLETRYALASVMVSMELNHHGVKTVIIERLDCLARDLMVQEAILNDFRKGGFQLISVHENQDLLGEDPTRKLARHVFDAVAEYDRIMTVLKARAARDRKLIRAGRCEVRKSYEDTMPELFHLIKELRRKPKGGKRTTYGQVAEELNRRGFKNRSGSELNGQIVQKILRK
jgi:DNA invertase Pin-like site-specific DNA recombinase